jgi:heme oxygenase
MPDLNVVDWKFDLDGPRVRKDRKGDGTPDPHHPNGQPTDRRDTYLVHPTRTCAVKKPQETLRDPEHRTTKALREIGVDYVVQGAGRGAKSFLVKHARL